LRSPLRFCRVSVILFVLLAFGYYRYLPGRLIKGCLFPPLSCFLSFCFYGVVFFFFFSPHYFPCILPTYHAFVSYPSPAVLGPYSRLIIVLGFFFFLVTAFCLPHASPQISSLSPVLSTPSSFAFHFRFLFSFFFEIKKLSPWF